MAAMSPHTRIVTALVLLGVFFAGGPTTEPTTTTTFWPGEYSPPPRTTIVFAPYASSGPFSLASDDHAGNTTGIVLGQCGAAEMLVEISLWTAPIHSAMIFLLLACAIHCAVITMKRFAWVRAFLARVHFAMRSAGPAFIVAHIALGAMGDARSLVEMLPQWRHHLEPWTEYLAALSILGNLLYQYRHLGTDGAIHTLCQQVVGTEDELREERARSASHLAYIASLENITARALVRGSRLESRIESQAQKLQRSLQRSTNIQSERIPAPRRRRLSEIKASYTGVLIQSLEPTDAHIDNVIPAEEAAAPKKDEAIVSVQEDVSKKPPSGSKHVYHAATVSDYEEYDSEEESTEDVGSCIENEAVPNSFFNPHSFFPSSQSTRSSTSDSLPQKPSSGLKSSSANTSQGQHPLTVNGGEEHASDEEDSDEEEHDSEGKVIENKATTVSSSNPHSFFPPNHSMRGSIFNSPSKKPSSSFIFSSADPFQVYRVEDDSDEEEGSGSEKGIEDDRCAIENKAALNAYIKPPFSKTTSSQFQPCSILDSVPKKFASSFSDIFNSANALQLHSSQVNSNKEELVSKVGDTSNSIVQEARSVSKKDCSSDCAGKSPYPDATPLNAEIEAGFATHCADDTQQPAATGANSVYVTPQTSLDDHSTVRQMISVDAAEHSIPTDHLTDYTAKAVDNVAMSIDSVDQRDLDGKIEREPAALHDFNAMDLIYQSAGDLAHDVSTEYAGHTVADGDASKIEPKPFLAQNTMLIEPIMGDNDQNDTEAMVTDGPIIGLDLNSNCHAGTSGIEGQAPEDMSLDLDDHFQPRNGKSLVTVHHSQSKSEGNGSQLPTDAMNLDEEDHNQPAVAMDIDDDVGPQISRAVAQVDDHSMLEVDDGSGSDVDLTSLDGTKDDEVTDDESQHGDELDSGNEEFYGLFYEEESDGRSDNGESDGLSNNGEVGGIPKSGHYDGFSDDEEMPIDADISRMTQRNPKLAAASLKPLLPGLHLSSSYNNTNHTIEKRSAVAKPSEVLDDQQSPAKTPKVPSAPTFDFTLVDPGLRGSKLPSPTTGQTFNNDELYVVIDSVRKDEDWQVKPVDEAQNATEDVMSLRKVATMKKKPIDFKKQLAAANQENEADDGAPTKVAVDKFCFYKPHANGRAFPCKRTFTKFGDRECCGDPTSYDKNGKFLQAEEDQSEAMKSKLCAACCEEDALDGLEAALQAEMDRKSDDGQDIAADSACETEPYATSRAKKSADSHAPANAGQPTPNQQLSDAPKRKRKDMKAASTRAEAPSSARRKILPISFRERPANFNINTILAPANIPQSDQICYVRPHKNGEKFPCVRTNGRGDDKCIGDWQNYDSRGAEIRAVKASNDAKFGARVVNLCIECSMQEDQHFAELGI